MRIVANSSSPILRAVRPARLFGVQPVPILRIVEGTGEVFESVDLDRINQVTSQSDSYLEYQLRPLIAGGSGQADISYESLSPSVAAVNSTGFVTRVSDGFAYVLVHAAGGTQRVLLDMRLRAGQTVTRFSSYAVGSLARSSRDLVESMIVNRNAQTGLHLFTTQDHNAGVYVRNPNCWATNDASPVQQLTAISPWNSQGGRHMAGTLLSTRDVGFATHYAPAIGTQLRFVTLDNQVRTRTIVARRSLTQTSLYHPDITLALLDSDLTEEEGIYFAYAPPVDILDYLPTNNSYYDGRLSCLCLDQEEKALVTDLYRELLSTSFSRPLDPHYATFYEDKIGGDSGNPAFLLVRIGGIVRLIALTFWTFGGAGSGTSIRQYLTAINAAMTANGSPYQLTPAPLSGNFTNYA